jgi:hypothetical protein
MNERILSPQLLKLVQEAGPGYSLADPKWVKKFAELIVAECANVVWDEAHKADNAEINDVGYKILKHFGVEA